MSFFTGLRIKLSNAFAADTSRSRVNEFKEAAARVVLCGAEVAALANEDPMGHFFHNITGRQPAPKPKKRSKKGAVKPNGTRARKN